MSDIVLVPPSLNGFSSDDDGADSRELFIPSHLPYILLRLFFHGILIAEQTDGPSC